MDKYRVKKLYDENGVLTGYSNPTKVVGQAFLRENEQIIYSSASGEFLRAELVDREIQVVEDTAKGNLEGAKRNAATLLKNKLKNLKKTDLSNATARTDAIMDIVNYLKDSM